VIKEINKYLVDIILINSFRSGPWGGPLLIRVVYSAVATTYSPEVLVPAFIDYHQSWKKLILIVTEFSWVIFKKVNTIIVFRELFHKDHILLQSM
jgi:hypothetical protein